MRSFTFISYLLFFFFGLFAVVSALPEPVDDTTRELVARGGWDHNCWEKDGWNKCDDDHCCHDKEKCCGKSCCEYGKECVKHGWNWECCKDKDCKGW